MRRQLLDLMWQQQQQNLKPQQLLNLKREKRYERRYSHSRPHSRNLMRQPLLNLQLLDIPELLKLAPISYNDFTKTLTPYHKQIDFNTISGKWTREDHINSAFGCCTVLCKSTVEYGVAPLQ